MAVDTINESVRMWEAEPAKAKVKPSATARIEGRQVAIESGAFSWRAASPPPLGGTGDAPSPSAYLLGALAGCAAGFITDTIAPQLGIRISSIEATVTCDADFRGLVGIGGVAPDLQNIALDIRIASPDGDQAVQRIVDVWKERCPVYLAFIKPTPVSVHAGTVSAGPA